MRCVFFQRSSRVASVVVVAAGLAVTASWAQEAPQPPQTPASEQEQPPNEEATETSGRTEEELSRELNRRALERQIAEQARKIEKKATQIERQIQELEELKALLDSLQLQLAALTEPKDKEAEAKDKEELAREIGLIRGWEAVKFGIKDLTTVDIKDGKYKFIAGLRMQLDSTRGSEDAAIQETVGPLNEGLLLRRFRLWAEGTVFYKYTFVAQYELGVDSGPKDFYIEGLFHRVLKGAEFRLGYIREPFGMEERTSSQFITFLERSTPLEALSPGHNLGFMFSSPTDAEKRWTWAAGTFTNVAGFNLKSGASDFALTARGTGLPLAKHEDRQLIHLGLALSGRDTQSNSIRYRSRPEARSADFYIDTEAFDADRNALYGGEVASVFGPYWTQAELLVSQVDSDELDDPVFTGWYFQIGRFITGEHRPYDRANGTFGRVFPSRNFEKGVGPGAWEVALRYSSTDLDEGEIQGGLLDNLSLGVSWYVTPWTKLTANYIHADRVDTGRANIFVLRFEYDGR